MVADVFRMIMYKLLKYIINRKNLANIAGLYSLMSECSGVESGKNPGKRLLVI